MVVTPERNGVFVSYAKEDSAPAAQLMAKLVPIARDGVIEVFWDEAIKPGRHWHNEILEALGKARVGMLLVSDAFLGSRYIAEYELPFLVGEADAGRIELFWFLLTKSVYEHTPLGHIQGAHDLDQPLIQLDAAGVDAVFGDAARKVAELLLPGQPPELPVAMNREARVEAAIQPEHRYSTGAAIGRVAEDVEHAVLDGSITSLDALFRFAEERAQALRGTMIPFRHFFKLGPHYPLAQWPSAPEVIAAYLGRWIEYQTRTNERLGREFAEYVGRSGGSFALAEYSRAVLSGLRVAAEGNQDAFRIITGMRPTAEVVEEPEAFARRLREEGWSHVEELLGYEAWIGLLQSAAESHAPGAGGTHVHMVLFGAEGLISDGGVVFPQRLLEIETDWLKRMREVEGTKVVCVAEAYKIMPPEVNDGLRALEEAGRYTIVPAEVFDALVTDQGVLYPQADRTFDTAALRATVLEESRHILDRLTTGERLLPFAQAPDSVLTDAHVLVADVDDTITVAGQLPANVLASLEQLEKIGQNVLLITGRSAGWGQSLARYLPAVSAVVAENGLVLCRRDESLVPLRPEAAELDLDDLANTAARLQARFGLVPTEDDAFRLYERTFVRPEGFLELTTRLTAELDDHFEVVASSIHVHLRHRGWDKSSGLNAALQRLALGEPDGVLVVGDSANDAPLFRDHPTRSIGVANLLDYTAELGNDQPRWVTAGREGDGFLEVVERILAARKGEPRGE